ncbi:DUF58 domain-containing protein [Salinibacterium sp. ZJ77]|uniref:DUF58 domain-containing protein n=1 Tax=Salinibacterium sp. ZJ77 TaxID=2708337 RepID=UPI0014201A11|nr:DUF58 domain-containing protein [Salinibacterium sp. ZJ77]
MASADSPSTLRRVRYLRVSLRGLVTAIAGVACAAAGYAWGRPELVVAGAFAVLLALGGLAVGWLRRPTLEVVRLFSPPVVAVASPCHVTLRVRNSGMVTTPTFLWNDAIPWHEVQTPQELAPLPSRPASRRVGTIEYVAHPPRRGVFTVGPLVLESGDPFGMVRVHEAVGSADRLTVVPAVTPLAAGGPVLIDGDGSAQLVQRRVVGSDDDLSTREYRRGDALRRVHWRASARHGELMVRQEEHRSHPDARIIIDTRASGHPDAEPDLITEPPGLLSESFEWSVRMLASLAVHLDEVGFRVGVAESAPQQVAPVGEPWEGGQRFEAFLTSLASIRLQSADAPLPPLDADAVGPTFAVLADADDEVIDWVLRQRRPGQAGAVFVLGLRLSARERFVDAGWTCIDAMTDDDIGDVWRSATNGAGVAHGAR